MEHSKDKIQHVAHAIAQSGKTSATAAGPAEAAAKAEPSPALIDAINQVFALLRINFHNQFHSAYSDTQLLNLAKKLWLDSLRRFDPDTVLAGAKRVIESADYLPTLHKMISACEQAALAGQLPDTDRAYREACLAPEPKAAQAWSHPAVYQAGREAGWFLLASEPEAVAKPVFARAYRRWCERVLAGEAVPAPEPPALPDQVYRPLSKAENAARLARLRRELDL